MLKIQVVDPTEDDHAIFFPEMNFHIPLSLWGIFPYFPTSKPTQDELVEPSDMYILTPTTWNPHSEHYAHNKENTLDWEGNMKEKKDHVEWRIVLDELEEDTSSLFISEVESIAISDTFLDEEEPMMTSSPYNDDVIAAMTAQISTTLHTGTLYEVIKDRAEDGIFKANIGSTNVYIETMMMDDNNSSSADSDTSMEEGDGDMSVINMFGDWEGEEINEFMMSAMTAMKPSGGSPEHLSKVL